MSEKTLVIQHNAIIEARYRLSVEEQRLVKTLISLIQPNDEDFKPYEIRVSDLAKLLEISDTSYYSRVKKVTRQLLRNHYLLEFVGENGKEIQTRWLSSAVYSSREGTVELRFDPVLKPYLLHLKGYYTPYELGNILRLKGMYSIRIYELLKQYEKIGKREFTLEDFRRILYIDTKYSEYRELKKYVLSPAKNEICEKTDISFSMEEKRRGRKVIGLVFLITKKQRPETEIFKIDLPKEKCQETPENEYVKKLVDFGVTRFIAEQLVIEFDNERIDRAIAYTKEKNGTLKDPAAFVVVAIQKDYTDSKSKEKEKKVEELQLQLDQEKLKKEWQKIKSQYEAWKKDATEAILSEIPTETIESYRQQFIDSFTNNTVMLNSIRKSKNTEKRYFLLYMYQHLTLDSLEIWAQKNAIDLSVFPTEIQK